MKIHYKTLKLVWALVKAVGWSEEQFRGWLEENWGQRHMHAMTAMEFDEMLKCLKGQTPKNSRLSFGDLNYITSMARQLVRDQSKIDNYIQTVCQAQTGVSNIHWLTSHQAWKVKEALKAALKNKRRREHGSRRPAA